jgi:alanyl-tRNA synthetase
MAKSITNSNLRIDIEVVNATDSVELKKIQQKINNWITKQEHVKHEILVSGPNLVFHICRKKTE